MLGLISGQLPWWVTGPGVGLCVVALYGLINARLGVSGAWLATPRALLTTDGSYSRSDHHSVPRE